VSSGGGSNINLQHDQQVSFAQGISPVVAVDGHSATDWTRGRLAFVDQPLAAVVADLARYTTRDIVISDPAAGDLRYTGTIEADAIDQWVAALIRVYPVEADRDGDRVTLRFRPHN
jgi:transmembrane sensor